MKTTDELRHFHPLPLIRRWFSLFWLAGWVLLAAACQPGAEDEPDNLIPQDKMVQILTDIHLAEAKVTRLGISSADSLNLIYKRMEQQIYTRYKLDTATYNRSYTYYSSNPEKLADIYRQVVERLEKKQTKKP